MVQISAHLQKYNKNISSEIIDHLISGSLQEFERRAGQKEKVAQVMIFASVEVIMNHSKFRSDTSTFNWNSRSRPRHKR